MSLNEWAIRHHVGMDALAELKEMLGRGPAIHLAPGDALSEAGVQSRVRLAAPAKRMRLWRNNVGALVDARGVPVRYGLANESPAMNKAYKSSDLIGSTTVTVTPAMVGTDVAILTAIECKESAWRYTGTPREVAQAAFHGLVIADGGYARFVNDVEQL